MGEQQLAAAQLVATRRVLEMVVVCLSTIRTKWLSRSCGIWHRSPRGGDARRHRLDSEPASAEQFKLRPPVALPIDQLDATDMSLYRPG
jgi:hypothetical protein